MINVNTLKIKVKSEQYYKNTLSGVIGSSSGNGWHLWNGLCPFHTDRKAGSFYINKRTGAFKCFSCGASGGDIIDFQKQKYNQSFTEAVNTLKGELS